MLCFESLNFGIMQSEKKPYEVAQSFCQSNPELVKKIAKVHPEYFVDGSIVEACIKAMPQDQEFVNTLNQNIKYMKMNGKSA